MKNIRSRNKQKNIFFIFSHLLATLPSKSPNQLCVLQQICLTPVASAFPSSNVARHYNIPSQETFFSLSRGVTHGPCHSSHFYLASCAVHVHSLVCVPFLSVSPSGIPTRSRLRRMLSTYTRPPKKPNAASTGTHPCSGAVRDSVTHESWNCTKGRCQGRLPARTTSVCPSLPTGKSPLDAVRKRHDLLPRRRERMNSTRVDELASQSETDVPSRAESSRHVDGVSVDDDDGGSSGKGSPSYGEGILKNRRRRTERPPSVRTGKLGERHPRFALNFWA